MGFALAKIKRLQNNPYVKLMSDVDLYQSVDLGKITKVAFNIDHKLDEDSWFFVGDFKSKQYCPEILKKDIDSKNYLEITKKQFLKIHWIMSKQGENLYFQKIVNSSFLKAKTFAFGDIVHLEENESRLVVSRNPDAVYFTKGDSLIFRNISAISSIFSGVDELYREATDADVVRFIGSDFIYLDGEYGLNNVSKPNRKIISMVLDRLDEMQDDVRNELIGYISDYCVDLEVSNDRRSFVVKNDIDLKKLIYGLDERYYTTGMGNQRRIANSVQVVG